MCILKKIFKRKKKEKKQPKQECWYNNIQRHEGTKAAYEEGGGMTGNAYDMAVVMGIFSN